MDYNISKKENVKKLLYILDNRIKYIKHYFECDYEINNIDFKNGIFILNNSIDITISEYYTDFYKIYELTEDGSLKSFCHDRFKYLLLQWDIYKSSNKKKEFNQRIKLKKDFYTVPKVDTHIHHSSAMNQNYLLQFIKKKNNNNPDDIVLNKNNNKLKLSDIINKNNFNLNCDLMNVHAVGEKHCFMRFDKFNSKYNPCGLSDLRNIFLKSDNYINGKYLAEITRDMINQHENNEYLYSEWRISIYGKNIDEWYNLADWICNNNLLSKKIKWFIQIPRLYHIYKKNKFINNFQEMLYNIFYPIINNTINPNKHKNLNKLLKNIGGFDTVDDETKYDLELDINNIITPDKWNNEENPPYNYYMYYMYYNICSLNKLRISKKMNIFEFRPHCGEGGSKNHIISGFLLCTYGISHGIKIIKNPVYKYIYYLSQIGISLSPLSNNALVMNYLDNPLPIMFRAGLNVTLSTDDPLMFHYTKEALMEEYSIAAQIWHLSNTDICELSKNSVLQSSMSKYIIKKHYNNNINNDNYTNIPKIRMEYRKKNLENEFYLLKNIINF